MTASTDAYDEIIVRITEWAAARTDVHAALIVGSRARATVTADAWSDLDMVLFVDDTAPYLDDARWVAAFGEPILTFVEPAAVGDLIERRVLYDGGLDVDLVLAPAATLSELARRDVDPAVSAVVSRGVRVIVDKAGDLTHLGALAGQPDPPGRPPTQAAFDQAVNDFLYHAVWTAKKLRRGEVWIAKGCSDGMLRRRLQETIEWHALVTSGADTWHAGRFLERWADPRVLADLPDACAAYDAADLWRGLSAAMELFSWVAREVADRTGLCYPSDAERQVRHLVHHLNVTRH